MNWIERIFQIIPDDGSGGTECLIFFAALAGVAVYVARRRRVLRPH